MKRSGAACVLFLAGAISACNGSDEGSAGAGDGGDGGAAESGTPDTGQRLTTDAGDAAGALPDASAGGEPLDAAVAAMPDAGSGPVALLHARAQHTATVVNDKYLYIIGGDAPGSLASVERAEILPDGTLGHFVDAGVSLVTSRLGHAAFVGGDKLYVLGGSTRDASSSTATGLKDIEEATISADGTLGAFTVSTVSLDFVRQGIHAVVSGDWLYLSGGARAPLDANGVPGTFVDDHFALGFNSFAAPGLVLSGANAYGFDAVAATTKAARAAVATDGTIGGFTEEAGIALTQRHASGFATAVVGDKLCVIGGIGNAGSPYATVEVATINTDGSLGAFAVSANPLSSPRIRHTATVIGDKIAVIGGSTGTGVSAYSNAVELITP